MSELMQTIKSESVAPWLWQMVREQYTPSPLRTAASPNEGSVGMPWETDGATRIGDVLRQALLLNPSGSALPGLSLAVTYAPAFTDQGPVGGDFFDAFALPGEADEIALLIGDMPGKGVGAAVHIAAIKYALRAFLREPSEVRVCPGRALTRLNTFVCHAQALDGWEPEGIVSAALVLLNTTTGEGRFALAAAEAPLILPQSRVADTPPYGLPLGTMVGHTYQAASFHLPEDATLLLLTDGLTEARHPQRTPTGGVEMLGYEGVARFATSEHTALSHMGRTLLEQVRAYAGGRLRDDACLLLARRHR